jgi:hypothetical protein
MFFRNFYNFLITNTNNLEIDKKFLNIFRNNIRFTSKEKELEMSKKYPKFIDLYETYLESTNFKSLISLVKKNYDGEYLQRFFQHAINFLNCPKNSKIKINNI